MSRLTSQDPKIITIENQKQAMENQKQAMENQKQAENIVTINKEKAKIAAQIVTINNMNKKISEYKETIRQLAEINSLLAKHSAGDKE